MKSRLKLLASVLAALLLVVSSGCVSPPPVEPLKEKGPRPEIIAASYNIHAGHGLDKRLDLGRIATVLTSQHVDVVGLQEVDRHVKRTGGIDELADLERLTGMNGVFGKSIDFQGGEYGIAILTTGKILEHRHAMYPRGGEPEARSYLLARIQFQNGFVAWVADTHLGLNHTDRLTQAATLLKATADLDAPVILMGDFNETPDQTDQPIYKEFARSFVDTWTAAPMTSLVPVTQVAPYKVPPIYNGATFPSSQPEKRIDYIWVKPRAAWTVERCWVGGTFASDHLPLFAELKPAAIAE